MFVKILGNLPLIATGDIVFGLFILVFSLCNMFLAIEFRGYYAKERRVATI